MNNYDYSNIISYYFAATAETKKYKLPGLIEKKELFFTIFTMIHRYNYNNPTLLIYT